MTTTKSRQERRKGLQSTVAYQDGAPIPYKWPDLTEHDKAFLQAKKEFGYGLLTELSSEETRRIIHRAEQIRKGE